MRDVKIYDKIIFYIMFDVDFNIDYQIEVESSYGYEMEFSDITAVERYLLNTISEKVTKVVTHAEYKNIIHLVLREKPNYYRDDLIKKVLDIINDSDIYRVKEMIKNPTKYKLRGYYEHRKNTF